MFYIGQRYNLKLNKNMLYARKREGIAPSRTMTKVKTETNKRTLLVGSVLRF